MAAGDITISRSGDKILFAIEGNNTQQFSLSNTNLRFLDSSNEIELMENGVKVHTFDHEKVVSPSESTTAALFTTLTEEGGIFFLGSPLPTYANQLSASDDYPYIVVPTANVDLATFEALAAPIDGFTVDLANVASVIVFLINQTDPKQNGPYLVDAPGGDELLHRHPSYDTGAELNALMVTVSAGDTYSGTTWYQNTATPDVGVDNIAFIPAAVMIEGSDNFSQAVTFNPGSGITVRHLHNTRLLQVDIFSVGGPANGRVVADDILYDEEGIGLDLTTAAPSGRVIVMLQSPTIPV